MIEISEAESLLKKHHLQGEPVTISLDVACGRVIAEDIQAPEPVPRYSSSAMDGIAIRFPVAVDTPVPIAGESAAGSPFLSELPPGSGILISTGALIPDKAEAVIPVEDLVLESNHARIRTLPRDGAHIRKAGEELEQGECMLAKGTVLTPAALGLLATVGIVTIPVFAKPRITIITSGDEVVPPEATPERYQLRNSNATILNCILHHVGMKPVAVCHAGDTTGDVRQKLEQAASSSDIIVTTGGVSMGNHDLMRTTAEAIGFDPIFWQVRQKPGKPLFFGKKENCVLFGLPGNPVSTLMCAVHYLLPYLYRFSGKKARFRGCEAVLTRPYQNHGNRHRFFLVELQHDGHALYATPVHPQRSHTLSGPAVADGYAILQPGESAAGGEKRQIILMPWRT